MRCAKCGAATELDVLQTLTAEGRGESVTVQARAGRCGGCGRVILTSKGRRAYHRACSDAYRRLHGLLTTSEIDGLRRNLGMTWKQFADYVDVGIASLKRWMAGEIQSSSMDALVRYRADHEYAQRETAKLLSRLEDSAASADEVVGQTVVLRRSRWSRPTPTVCVDSELALCA